MQSIAYLPGSNGVLNASVATVQVLRSAGATSNTVNTVSGFPTFFYATMGTPHTFVDPVTGETITVISDATAVDFAGTINAGKIDIVAIAPGYTDLGSKVGDIIIVRPITEWANNLKNILSAEHKDDGKHGNITVDSILANTSNQDLTNQDLYSNAIINGGCQVAQRSDTSPALSTTSQYGQVDRFRVHATGTAVSAGTIIQSTTPAIATDTGCSLKVAGATITGTGVLIIRHRIEAKEAVKFVNKAASFGVKVRQDTGGAINATVLIRKPTTTADDFSATTLIATSSTTSVPNNTDTTVKFENINSGTLGDVSKGIEIEIQLACGAVTTKNFEFYGFNFNLGSKAATYRPRPYMQDFIAACRYYQQYTEPHHGGSVNAGGNGVSRFGWAIPYEMRVSPTVTATQNIPVFDGSGVSAISAITVFYNSRNRVQYDGNMSSALGATRFATAYSAGATTPIFKLDAEL